METRANTATARMPGLRHLRSIMRSVYRRKAELENCACPESEPHSVASTLSSVIYCNSAQGMLILCGAGVPARPRWVAQLGRAAVSKTAGCRFDSCPTCHYKSRIQAALSIFAQSRSAFHSCCMPTVMPTRTGHRWARAHVRDCRLYLRHAGQCVIPVSPRVNLRKVGQTSCGGCSAGLCPIACYRRDGQLARGGTACVRGGRFPAVTPGRPQGAVGDRECVHCQVTLILAEALHHAVNAWKLPAAVSQAVGGKVSSSTPVPGANVLVSTVR
jgi:hypothetical protein